MKQNLKRPTIKLQHIIRKRRKVLKKQKLNLMNVMKIGKKKRSHLDKQSEKLSKLEPSVKPADHVEHQLLKDQKEKWKSNDKNYNVISREITTEKEIEILERKLKYEREGLVYRIILDTYDEHDSSFYTEKEFSSEEERMEKQRKESTTSDSSSWNVNAEVEAQHYMGYGGGAHDGGGKNSYTGKYDGKKEDKSTKTKNSVLERTFHYQKRRFKVNITLDDSSVRDAKHILNSPEKDRDKAIEEFLLNKKYRGPIYTGNYYAGGWFRTVANARSSKDMAFSALLIEATKKTDNYWASGATANYSAVKANVGAGRKSGEETRDMEETTHQTNHSEINVTLTEESYPGNTLSKEALEAKLENKQWDILKEMELSEMHFSKITQIMQEQANDPKYEDLSKVVEMIETKGSKASNENVTDIMKKEADETGDGDLAKLVEIIQKSKPDPRIFGRIDNDDGGVITKMGNKYFTVEPKSSTNPEEGVNLIPVDEDIHLTNEGLTFKKFHYQEIILSSNGEAGNNGIIPGVYLRIVGAPQYKSMIASWGDSLLLPKRNYGIEMIAVSYLHKKLMGIKLTRVAGSPVPPSEIAFTVDKDTLDGFSIIADQGFLNPRFYKTQLKKTGVSSFSHQNENLALS